MEIPKKFEVNTEDFKIYFDNNKKTHVCENLETGEKTNIGVIGIFLQMGIIKPIDEKTEDKIKNILDRLNSLEMKLNEIAKSINIIATKPEQPVIEKIEEKPKSGIKERIMKKVLKKAEEETEETVEQELENESEESDVVTESEDEIDAWSEI